MKTGSSLLNSPLYSGNTNKISTEGTLDQMFGEPKNLLVTGSDILMNAETQAHSKKLKNSFSN